MKNNNYIDEMSPDLWGLNINSGGELSIGNFSTVALAERYGTPLHVVNSARLRKTAYDFKEIFSNLYPGKTTVHYAFKCNPVPGVLQIVRKEGLNAEIMSDFELFLAGQIGFTGNEIIVNGPYKTANFLRNCIHKKVRLIIVDSLTELDLLNKICETEGTTTNILLRLNPDYIPKGMNQGSSTASRKGSPLGLDICGGELEVALDKLKEYHRLNFQGLHFHIGSGISNPEDYTKVLVCCKPYIHKLKKACCVINVFDVGGGFGTPNSKEMSSMEMLTYQAFGRLPRWRNKTENFSPKVFAKAVTAGMERLFSVNEMPELILEPGRCITSPNQLLLLSVHQVKRRNNGKTWLITDGGIGTVTMPTFYEFHKIFLCNEVNRKNSGRVTISGPGCFAADIVYRNIKMPVVKSGEIIAIMDSGAYFTSWESSFGHPLPAVIEVSEGQHQLLRHRESYHDKISRDVKILTTVKQTPESSLVSH